MSNWSIGATDAWVIVTAICCNVACGLLGCFLVLRRMSLLGDAVSHAILPGLVIAFMLSNSRAIGPMLIGAMLVGLFTAFMTEVLQRWGKVPEDASMGVVFTSLFALGVVLITRYAANVDLDPGCVLYGLIEFVPLDRIALLGYQIPRATVTLGFVLIAVVFLITAFYKELKIVSFDPYLATTMGINAALVHYALMAAVAATTVAAFEAVGSILVVAMLIAPGATAHLLTDRLSRMLWIAAGVAIVSAVVGYMLAAHPKLNTSVAGMMSVVAGAQFALAVLFAPRYGYVSKLLHQASLSLRIVAEDILGMLYRWEEARRDAPLTREQIVAAMAGGLTPRLALMRLARRRQVESAGGAAVRLTDLGRARAGSLIRTHRLWESYLAQHLGLPLDHLHEPAQRMEHFVTPRITEQLDAQLGAAQDPHGKEIPPAH